MLLFTCLIRFSFKARKLNRKYHTTYPICIRDVSDTALAQNIACVAFQYQNYWQVMFCCIRHVAGAVLVPPPHGPTPTSLFSTKTCPFFLLLFLLVIFVCKDCDSIKSPATMLWLAWMPGLWSRWCTSWHWKWCKNVAPVCCKSECVKRHFTLLKVM